MSRLNDWLLTVRPNRPSLSHLNWSHLTWNLAGTVISQSNKNSYQKTFLYKILYDALPNAYTQYKYSRPTQQDLSQNSDPDLPACPLCFKTHDSLSHTFLQCQHESLYSLRQKLITQFPQHLHSIHYADPIRFPTHTIINLLINNFENNPPDHRVLLGLFPSSIFSNNTIDFPTARTIFKKLSPNIFNFLHETWITYNEITHPSGSHTAKPSSRHRTSRPPRLTIIASNSAYYSRRSHTSRKPRSNNSCTQPSQISQLPCNPITTYFPLTQPTPRIIHNTYHSPSPHESSLTCPTPTTPLPESWSSVPPSSRLSQPTQKDPPRLFTGTSPTTSISTPSHSLTNNQYQPLEVIAPTLPDLNLLLPSPFLQIQPLPAIKGTTMSAVLHDLHLFAQDVPQNGDCFYLAIQLLLSHVHSPAYLISSNALRNLVYKLLTTTPVGSRILHDHNQSPESIALNVLPNLSHPSNIHRDIYASDCAIAAMATLLRSPITIFCVPHNDMPLKYSYLPYPHHTSNISTLPYLPNIILWQSHTHFQLLLPFQLQLPSITHNLLPLPSLPSINLTETSSPIHIPIPTNYPIHSQCLFTLPHNHPPTSFCPHPCNPHCQHHYNAFRPITIQRSPPQTHSSQIITLEALSPNPPILEISGTIYATPNSNTIPITSDHHSDVLLSHPLLRMLFCSHKPNCHLSPLLIPDPIPHLKLFLLTSTDVPPYESLRIRPPPEPPPSSLHRNPNPRAPASLITSYFQRTSLPSPRTPL